MLNLGRKQTPFMALALAACLVGCQSSLRVTVQSAEMTNAGRPLYLMVAAADGQTVLLESYEEAADRLFRDPRDKSILHRETVFPGNSQEFTLVPPDDQDVAVYVFFTHPAGEQWRYTLRRPVPSEVVFELGNRAINRVIVGGK